jgi:hypothetical protein
MKNRVITGLLIFLTCMLASAQDLTLPDLNGYKKITDYPVYGPENLWDFINGAADNYLAYGFIDLHVAEYKKGKNVIKLEIYRHKNNTLAFGIYSTERSPSFRYLNLGSQGYDAGGAINFFKGDYYVKIRTFSKNEKTLQAAESLAHNISGMLPGESKLPPALLQFPEPGKKQNEETFINESVLGHKFLNMAFKAVYEVGSDNFAIFIFEKNSAEESKKTVDEYLKSAALENTDASGGKYAFSDGYNGTVFLAWKDNKIVIISGLSKDQTLLADQYTSEIIK